MNGKIDFLMPVFVEDATGMSAGDADIRIIKENDAFLLKVILSVPKMELLLSLDMINEKFKEFCDGN